MANLFIEGWENYPTGTPSGSGSPWAGSGNWPQISTSGSITGSKSLQLSNGTARTGDFSRLITPSSDEVFFGYSFLPAAFNTSNTSGFYLNGATSLFRIVVYDLGALRLYRGTSLLDSADGIFLAGVKYFIEAHVTPTTYEVYVDGNLLLSGSMSSIGSFNSIGVSQSASTTPGLLDDIYINDISGDTNNNLLGEISVLPLYPDTDESPQDWDLSSGSDAYSLIGVSTPSDGNYISAQNADDEAAFTFEEIPFPVTDIFVVQTTYRAQKESSGESAVQLSLTHGGSTEAGEENFTAEATYAWYFDSFELDPDTEEAWDPDTFDPKVTLKRTV